MMLFLPIQRGRLRSPRTDRGGTRSSESGKWIAHTPFRAPRTSPLQSLETRGKIKRDELDSAVNPPAASKHFRAKSIFAAVLVATALASYSGAQAAEVPSFRNDVIPVLSAAGCNSGGCHGALAGKGGFHLSLFGYNPEADYQAITKESRGRRIEMADPGRSLVLIKPTTALAHKGGKRLDVDSEDYRILADWIAGGAPGPKPTDPVAVSLQVLPEERLLKPGETQRLRVIAKFSDGREREVTRWVKFSSTDATVAEVAKDGTVTILGPGEGAVTAWYSSLIAIARVTVPYPYDLPESVFTDAPRANFIDDQVLEQLRSLRLKPSPPATDAAFVRRAFLDTIGRLPRTAETRAFLTDPTPGKHARLVDQLLTRTEFVDYWAYKWSDLLLVNSSKLRPEPLQSYYNWIHERVADQTPWDEFVRGIVTARGSSVENGASNFYAVHQDPESMAENVSKAFLSLSINCAHCHNHPLEKWTNDQYYSFANLFARVRAKGWGGDARSGDGQRTLYVDSAGDLIQPRTGKPQPPAPLDAPALPMDAPGDRREVLADWLTSPENPYFTRAIVNRVWANFFGIGLVEPVDDLRASNPASNEKLLTALSQFVIEQRYDLRALMRLILTSHTYRRSSDPLPENGEDHRYFSRYYPRRLMAEVLSDAIADVTGVSDSFSELLMNDGSTEKTKFYRGGTRAVQLYDSSVKSYFLKTFGRNPRDITCECERSNQPSLVQVLHLSNGETINDKLTAPSGNLTRLLNDYSSAPKLVSDAWMLCLGREPTPNEREKFEGMLNPIPTEERRPVVEDMFWALLTSREFLFQH